MSTYFIKLSCITKLPRRYGCTYFWYGIKMNKFFKRQSFILADDDGFWFVNITLFCFCRQVWIPKVFTKSNYARFLSSKRFFLLPIFFTCSFKCSMKTRKKNKSFFFLNFNLFNIYDHFVMIPIMEMGMWRFYLWTETTRSSLYRLISPRDITPITDP